MPFTVIATSGGGVSRFPAATAREAMDKFIELENSGWQHISVRDDVGRTLSRDEIALLAFPSGQP